jgi:hypothetical protein
LSRPADTTDEELRGIFGKCGTIESIRIMIDRKTTLGKGVAYVNFENREDVVTGALLDGTLLRERVRGGLSASPRRALLINFFLYCPPCVADPGDAHGRREEARPGEALAPVGDAGDEEGHQGRAAAAAAQLEEGMAFSLPAAGFRFLFPCLTGACVRQAKHLKTLEQKKEMKKAKRDKKRKEKLEKKAAVKRPAKNTSKYDKSTRGKTGPKKKAGGSKPGTPAKPATPAK